MQADAFQWVMTIRAEADPFVAMRVLAFVAVDNSLPTAFSARQLRDGCLKIVLKLSACTHRRAEFLARKFETIPTVLSVEVANSL